MKRGITDSQARVLEFIRGEIATHGSAPTYREIAAKFKWKSPKAAVDHVERLAVNGYVRLHRGRSRGIEVLVGQENPQEHTVSVPVRGTIAAGLATDASEIWAGRIQVDRSLIGKVAEESLFALCVRGDSMTGRGINEGDIAVAAADVPPRTGDIVVALIDGGSTLKTLATGSGGAFLKSENPFYPDLFPITELTIQGVVRALIRKVG